MRFDRPFCNKVIPLTYDNSLSYYETLCKVIKRLNDLYSNTEDMVKEILDEMGLGESVRFRNVYNVKDYGAKGDGVTDDRLSIQEALTVAYEAGGGIVFVPEGHYIVSKCIVIGNNCSLVGTGAGSIIEVTDLQPFWGTAIGVVGSNAGCSNLKVLYAENPAVTRPIVSGAAWGAVGITTNDYYSSVAQRHGTKTPIENVIVSDLYTEGFYALQVEPTSSAKNILYKNIYASGGMVSIQGASPYEGVYGQVSNVVCDNIICDYFRIIGANYVDGVYVTNLHTHYIYTYGNDVHFENFRADTTLPSPFDGSGVPLNDMCCQFLNYVNPENSVIKRCSASNGAIIGKSSPEVGVGLAIVATSKYVFENIYVRGFTRRNIAGALNSDTIFIGCDANEAGITNSPTGTGVNNDMGSTYTGYNDAWTSVYTDVSSSITFSDAYQGTGAQVGDSYIVKNGNLIYGNICALKKVGVIALQDVICTLPFKPARDVYCTGLAVNLQTPDNDQYPNAIILKIDTDGVVTYHHNALKQATPRGYNAFYCSFVFSKIHPEA